jgi:tRNA threonylcarbamoyladenosine biosynthesis protein TsaB
MALILNIDTATEIATLSVSENNLVLGFSTNNNQKDHASFLQSAIKALLKKCDLQITELNAVAVTAGPGSYTGLRVGMASTKGLCYALNIPLITINTLEVMALAAINKIKDDTALYCPMIDAKRMEVFTAIYDHTLKDIVKPTAVILNDKLFEELLKKNKIYFSESGSLKFKMILKNENAIFLNNITMHEAIAHLSYTNYVNNIFSNVAYASPLYIKEFYTIASKPKE